MTVENENESPPKWEMYIKFLKAVNMVRLIVMVDKPDVLQSFSGSLNAQRILLQRFFFPPTYEDLTLTRTPALVGLLW